MLPIDQVGELLSMISEEKKISFDKEYAEQLYREYNEAKVVDDTIAVKDLRKIFKDKTVLLVAPGKSITEYKEEIDKLLNDKDILSIGLNLTNDDFMTDYVLTTRKDVYDQAVANNRNVIVTSAVSKGGRGNVKILNYKNWINVDERVHDSSAVISTNLLKACGVKEILLAGLDGFSSNINENYSDPNMRRPVTDEQAHRRNAYFKELFANLRKEGIVIKFVTPSKYE